MLILLGYFGPTLILALLGISFVLPSGEGLMTRGVALFVLVGGLLLVDRLGVIRTIGTRPARALARRLIGADTFETWVTVGDHVIATVLVPLDPERAEPMIAALNKLDVKILAVEPAERGQPMFPDASTTVVPRPGERVVAFGPEQAFESVRFATT